MIAINLDGGWFVLQEAIKLMIEKGNGGRVVNMSSVTATRWFDFWRLKSQHQRKFETSIWQEDRSF